VTDVYKIRISNRVVLIQDSKDVENRKHRNLSYCKR